MSRIQLIVQKQTGTTANTITHTQSSHQKEMDSEGDNERA